MIGRIVGQLIDKQPPEVLVDVAGIGYEIQMPMTSFYQLPKVGEQVVIFTHFVVREDAQLLYGFADKFERALFRELIKANGIGPKMGLTILSGMSAPQFMQSVAQQDVSALVSLPGIGKKTAERLIVELKDRLKEFAKHIDIPEQVNQVGQSEKVTISSTPDQRSEAVSALVALGYKPAQAEKMVASVYQADMQSEVIIREALKATL